MGYANSACTDARMIAILENIITLAVITLFLNDSSAHLLRFLEVIINYLRVATQKGVDTVTIKGVET